MDKLEELPKQRKESHRQFKKFKSIVYEKFLELEEAAYSDRALTVREKLLIGMGISVVKNCEACMRWHIEEAARAGITVEEVRGHRGRYKDGRRPRGSLCRVRLPGDGRSLQNLRKFILLTTLQKGEQSHEKIHRILCRSS